LLELLIFSLQLIRGNTHLNLLAVFFITVGFSQRNKEIKEKRLKPNSLQLLAKACLLAPSESVG